MREKRRVEVEEITCDICHNEIDESDQKYIVLIPLKRNTETELDVCKECYYDLEDFFRERFKKEEI